jgi:SAM-dependent methyltransferase
VSGPLPPEVSAFVAASPIQRTPIARAVREAAATLAPGTQVLDAGAGEAPYRSLFAHCDYRTQDWPGSVHPGARAADVVADLHDLPIGSGSFDFVVCTEVLEHVADPVRCLRELRRVLADGGGILVTVPFVGELHEEPYDFRRYTSIGLRADLEAAGFSAVEVTPLTGYYGTLAHVLRHGGIATRPAGGGQRGSGRIASFALLCLSGVLQRLAPALDRRLDQRHALPVGWACRARAAI